jgi:hypothetical protein
VPTKRRDRWLLFVVCAVALVIGGGVYWKRLSTPSQRKFDGTIVSIDAEHHAGVLRFVHPKSGETIELRGEMGPGCEIVVAGRPATIADLHAGDRVTAEGQYYRISGKVVATRLTVLPKSEAGPETKASATMPALATPPEPASGAE